ncbi:MAG TPA: hypothetical protein DCR46_09295 [Cytophagales bacterium]|nr:hypothetical protein [Cytophagales bacterium]
MSSHQFVIVDTDNSLELCKYEKALFEEFNTTNNNLIREIWDWNYVEKRVKRRIPYSSQIIFTMQNENGEIDASISINTDKNDRQYNKMGFFNDEDVNEKSHEAFSTFIRPNSSFSNFQLIKFIKLVIETMKTKYGYNTSYGICPLNIYVIYKRLGCRVLEEKNINGEVRYFIKLNH